MALRPYNGFTPEQRVAGARWLDAEIAAGRARHPTRCHACGRSDIQVRGHSEDYSAPYGPHIGQFALCVTCHLVVHMRHRAPSAFAEYARQVANGAYPASVRSYEGVKVLLFSGGQTGTWKRSSREPLIDLRQMVMMPGSYPNWADLERADLHSPQDAVQ